jgi:hypothetical protein
MFEINGKADDNDCIRTIFSRARIFFLNQTTCPFAQDTIVSHLEQCFNTVLDENTCLNITMSLPDKHADNNTDNREWVCFGMDENQKIERVFATPDVVEAIFRVNQNTKLKTMTLYATEKNMNKTDYLFLLLSMVIFGSASYHYIIRKFFLFYF